MRRAVSVTLIYLSLAGCGITSVPPPLPEPHVHTDAGARPDPGDDGGPDAARQSSPSADVTTDEDAGSADTAGVLARPVEPIEVEVGIPDAVTRVGFAPILAGGDLFFSGGGQAGLSLRLAVRVRGLGSDVFVVIEVRDLAADASVMRGPWEAPDQLNCSSDDWCTLVPVLVGIEGLGDRLQLDGLPVTVTASVRAEDDRTGSATLDGVLRRL